jgi:hypothetical protein
MIGISCHFGGVLEKTIIEEPMMDGGKRQAILSRKRADSMESRERKPLKSSLLSLRKGKLDTRGMVKVP